MSKINKENYSALGKIGDLPRIKGASSDVSLSISYRKALKISADVLSEIEDEEKKRILESIFEVFDKWKKEHGVYPPKLNMGLATQILLGHKNEHPQIKASLYEEKEGVYLKPWECDNFARTPVRLFSKLLSEDFKSLTDLIDSIGWDKYPGFLATVILMTHDGNAEYQSSDVIEAAFDLASFKMRLQDSQLRVMVPDFEAAFNRRRQKKLKTKAKTEEKERKILLAYQECCSEHGEGNFPYKEIAARTEIPLSTVCRHLRNAGIGRYKSK